MTTVVRVVHEMGEAGCCHRCGTLLPSVAATARCPVGTLLLVEHEGERRFGVRPLHEGPIGPDLIACRPVTHTRS